MIQPALFDESIDAAKPPRPAPTREERIAWVREQRSQAHDQYLATTDPATRARLDGKLLFWENELRRLDPMEDLGGIGPMPTPPPPRPDHAATTLARNEAHRRLTVHRANPAYGREEDARILAELARHQKVLYEITGGYRA